MRPRLAQLHQSGAADGQAVVWDNTLMRWVPGDPVGGALALDDLTDVDTTTTPPTDGQMLVFDDASGLWVPGDGAAAPNGLPTGGADGQVLTKQSATDYDAAWETPSGGGGTYTAYTPTWTAATTNPVLGNGTLAGWYTQTGKKTHVIINLVRGSTTTNGTGTWRFSLPPGVTAAAKNTAGSATALDTSAGTRFGALTPWIASGGSIIAAIYNSTGFPMQSTSPFTWATGDTLDLSIEFEAA